MKYFFFSMLVRKTTETTSELGFRSEEGNTEWEPTEYIIVRIPDPKAIIINVMLLNGRSPQFDISINHEASPPIWAISVRQLNRRTHGRRGCLPRRWIDGTIRSLTVSKKGCRATQVPYIVTNPGYNTISTRDPLQRASAGGSRAGGKEGDS